MSDQEAIDKYGTKYYEFTNIVSHKTRTEIFGPSDYQPSDEPDQEEVHERKMMSPIGAQKKNVQKTEPRKNR